MLGLGGWVAGARVVAGELVEAQPNSAQRSSGQIGSPRGFKYDGRHNWETPGVKWWKLVGGGGCKVGGDLGPWDSTVFVS